MPLRTCLYPGCGSLVTSGYCEKHKNRVRYCAHPGCSTKVSGKSYCAVHDPNNRHDLHRGSASARGYDRSWERVRNSYRAMHPVCERCEAYGTVAAGSLVHHIVPLPEGVRLDFNNLMTLCRACHGILHRELEFSKEKYGREIDFIKNA